MPTPARDGGTNTGEVLAAGASTRARNILRFLCSVRVRFFVPIPADEGAGNLPVKLVRRQVASPRSGEPVRVIPGPGIPSCNLRAWAGRAYFFGLVARVADSCERKAQLTD
jgi:hypothetical protein